jgi:hypothetical protein
MPFRDDESIEVLRPYFKAKTFRVVERLAPGGTLGELRRVPVSDMLRAQNCGPTTASEICTSIHGTPKYSLRDLHDYVVTCSPSDAVQMVVVLEHLAEVARARAWARESEDA